jgi:PKD repeat protein
MPRSSPHFPTLGRMAVLASLGLSAACGGDGNGPSNAPPTAAFTLSCALLVCTFADGSSDADGQVTAYTWDFGDGTAAATTKNAQHTYAAANTYTVNLTVTDNDGAANGARTSVQVSAPANAPPTANFTSSCTDLACSFTDLSTDGDGTVVGFHWDFGDGLDTTTQNPTHAYASAGTYVVELAVTDDGGATNGVTQSVQVSTPANAPPTANFTSSCTDLACSFTDLSTDGDGTVVGFHWDFGDAAVAATRNPMHAYASAGTYVVELTVTDDSGATGNLPQQVTVTAGLTPTIWLSPTSFRFCYHPGSTRNCVHLTGELSITNVGSGTLNWEAKSNQSWLGVSPTSGTAPSPNVTVSVNLAGLPRGTYFGSITVSAVGASNSPQTVSVRLDY